MSDAHRFLGGWSLVSMTVHAPAGDVHPHGRDPIGTILYTPDHRFAAVLARRDVPAVESPEDARPDAALALVQGSVSYFGQWELNPSQTIVVHKPHWASWGRLLREHQVRLYQFRDDQLILRTGTQAGTGRYGEVVFERCLRSARRSAGGAQIIPGSDPRRP